MDNMNIDFTNFALIDTNTSLSDAQAIDNILLCNEKTKRYGLTLTKEAALALVKTVETSLKEHKRIEFGNGIVDKLIMAVCDSPYIEQETYEETLHEMIDLFYDLKNNTWDRVSDNDLITFIKTAFNGCCNGSMDLLIEKSMQLSEHIRSGKGINTFKLTEK